jgi:hypothetical protein
MTDIGEDSERVALEVLADSENAVGRTDGEHPVVILTPSLKGVCMTPRVARQIAAKLILAAEKAEDAEFADAGDDDPDGECDCDDCVIDSAQPHSHEPDWSIN